MDKPTLNQFFLPPADKYLDWYKVTDKNLPQVWFDNLLEICIGRSELNQKN